MTRARVRACVWVRARDARLRVMWVREGGARVRVMLGARGRRGVEIGVEG